MTVSARLSSLLEQKAMRRAKLWHAVRGSTNYYWTDHDVPITYDGQTYNQDGGFRAAAIATRDSLKGVNTQFVGRINDDVTLDDLRSGLWDTAQITEYLVDWKFPFMGAFRTTNFYVQEVDWDESEFKMHCGGVTYILAQVKGSAYTRTCRHDLGNAACGINLAGGSYTLTGCVVSAVTDRKTFRATDTNFAGLGDEYYDWGEITFTTGDNTGITREVRSSDEIGTAGTFDFVMFQRFPYDIETSDQFTAIVGCDRTLAECDTKFSNVIEFGGFQWMPGPDATLRLR